MSARRLAPHRLRGLAFACLFASPFALAPSARAGDGETPPDPEALIRQVARSQRLAESGLLSYTYDQLVTETRYAKDGRPKATERRLFYVFSGEDGGEPTRELVRVDGRPATDEEKQAAAERDEKQRRRRIEERAAAHTRRPPAVRGDDDDPLVGPRRLSDLLARFDYRMGADEVADGRLVYVVDFFPRREVKASSLGERALASLAGRVRIDAADFQVRSVEARLTKPVSVLGGLAAKVSEAVVTYTATPLAPGRWFPCVVDLRLKGRTALFFRLDAGYRFEMANFRTFGVTTEAEIGDKADGSVQSPR